MIAGVIFDLDGTLTRPLLNFKAIRKALGFDPAHPVLEQLLALPSAVQEEKNRILNGYEEEAASRCELNEGVADLLAWLEAEGKSTAILTRNSSASTRTMLGRLNLTFRHIRTREDEPVKPSPAQVVSLALEMGLPVERVLVVGDFAFDTEAGLSAGTYAVFLSNRNTPPVKIRYHFSIDSMTELRPLMEKIIHDGLPPGSLSILEEDSP